MEIQRLFIYPIKSLLPVEVTHAEVTREGFRFDRQYILIKEPENHDSSSFAEHLTIKKTFALALFQPNIHDDWSNLTVRHTKAKPESLITIPLTPSPLFCFQSRTYTVNIAGTSAIGIDMGDVPASFFSKHLGQSIRLLFIGGDGSRPVPGTADLEPSMANPGQRVRFADAAPFLLTSSSSENEARSRLPPSCQADDIILRLRPNIHIDVGKDTPAFDEDNWRQLTVASEVHGPSKAFIRCMSQTTRCLSLNADLETGGGVRREKQLFGLLARDRRVLRSSPNRPVFGCYAYVTPHSRLVGAVEIVESNVTGGSQAVGAARNTHSSALAMNVDEFSETKDRASINGSLGMIRAIEKRVLRPRQQRLSHQLPEVASTGVLQDSISDDDRFFDLDPAVYYEQEGKLCGVDFSASHPPPDIQPVTPCEVEVPSSTDPEEVLTPDLSPAVTRENTLYALLVRRFVEVISPWLDVFDPDRYFGYVVPIRASRSSLLRDSLAAVAAKQLGNLGCHTETQCNTDSSTAPEPLDPTVALSVDWSFEAASFYDRAIRSMINALQSIALTKVFTASPIHIETRLGSPPDRREAIDDLLSAMPILLVYELMDNRHLSMVQHLAGARHLLGFVLQQHEARTPGDAAYAPSLEQSVQKAWKASFWNFVCFDYVISYAGRSKPSIGFPDARLWHQSGLSLTEVDGQFVPASLVGDIHSSSPKMTETIACRTLLWIILRILDCVVSDGQVSEGQQANGRVHQRCRTTCHQGMGTAPWEQVDEYLRNWYMALPDTFEPCLRAPQPFPALASSSIRAPLQGFFIANPMGATALPLYHFSRILFLLHSHVTDEAFNSATGSRRIKIYRQFSRQVNHHAVEICSAAAGQPPPAAQMHLIQPLYLAGLCLDSQEQRSIIKGLLVDLQRQTGFPTERVLKQLEEGWDEDYD
ncbi:MOSC domain-containing protein 1, mitochondrial [Fusarium oxysporum f. sp. cubense race 1]|uniref:MOSC domain-containing protein 1, mitochondrial n=1 Tax=Fusarium oxysporum f. sp. cubense (strain race 1) TaxID=1229664 RepID=N4THX1_FUSC1|nr:MOSC domain-containing protein 1, mitochondrial [Fusarium oxysporum f. sp. cubense race 1]